MRTFIILLSAAWLTVSLSAQVTIDAGRSMLLTGGGPGQDGLPANLEGDVLATISTSGGACELRVMNAANDTQVRGFGLSANGRATVLVAEGERLLIDAADEQVKVNVTYAEATPAPATNAPSVAFTLRNSSLRSIPLRIPGVMNPNLSPMSKSGVSLEFGQEIIYKRKVILVVGPEIEAGSEIDVASLIGRR